MQLLSLFCGAGGLDLGFTLEGYHIHLAIDYSSAAITTHKHNFPESNALEFDLLDLGVDGLLDLCRKYFDGESSLGIIGGPPCQGFSRGNIKSYSEDPRNKLAVLYVDFIEALKKYYNIKFVVFENVLGIKDAKHITTYEKIIEKFNYLKFTVSSYVLNAIDFGVAQERKRVIIVALNPEFFNELSLKITPFKRKNVRDVIFSLPSPSYFSRTISTKEISHHPNHWTMVPKSAKFKDPSLLNGKTRSFRVIDWDKPSPTIAYGNREIHVHPSKTRRLSIYEAMLLQGFPENFELKGTFSQQVTQVSNAVPPPMAKAIAKAIKTASKGSGYE